MTIDDKLVEWQAGERVLLGVACMSNSTRICEMAGRIGFDTVWLELEHGTADFQTLETLCLATEAGGAIPVARIPDHTRHHILRTMETGARLVLVPMVNNAEIAQEIVHHGKFPPLGQRGFNSCTRGLSYGLNNTLDQFEQSNQTTHLIAQIETVEAMNELDNILEVEGISGVFIGPGDLSVALGYPAQFDHPRLTEAITTVIGKAKKSGKHVGLLGPDSLLQIGLKAGADFIFCGTDIVVTRDGWAAKLQRAQKGYR